ncbi:MAG: helix-turn-helix transcriptional regulator [Candidatus Eremiobacteraeota bacterium]|nr:helix-turn-helix transcriptional regulator [Candidatus Eremiobacteraeota bacterium]
MDKVVQILRTRRLELELTQKLLAHDVGCSQPYLSQVERGRRPLSEKMALRLEERLEIPGLLTTAPFLKGRPRLTDCSKKTTRILSSGAEPLVATPPFDRPPIFHQLHQKWGVEDRLAGMGRFFGEDADRLVEKLEEKKGPDQRYWRNLNSLRYDSWPERWFTAAFALLGAQLTGIRPAKLGCSLTIVNGKTGEEFKGCHRGFLFEYKGVSIAWVPQVAIRTEKMYRCPDNVLMISRGGRTVTAAVEYYGPHHTLSRMIDRGLEMGIPVNYMAVDFVGMERAIFDILDWAVELVA